MINTAGLTPRQAQALKFISASIAAGKTPSFAEIARALKIKSKNSVHRVVNGLRERGRITYMPGRARSIQLAPANTFLPVELRHALHCFCVRSGKKPEDIITEAVRVYLNAYNRMNAA